MTYLPLVLALIFGLIAAMLIGTGLAGAALFALYGAGGFVIGRAFPQKSETVYWLGLLILIVFIVINWLIMDLHRYLLIAPLVVMLGHFVSRLASRLFLGKTA